MPTGKNGTNLAEQLMPRAVATAAARLVDSLKINSVTEKMRRRHRVIIKQRNAYGERLAELSNLYFRMAAIPIRYWAKTDDWRRWEVDCFNMLNGDRFHAWARDEKTIYIDKLPGRSLWEHLERGTITTQMMEASGREFRRAHRFWSHRLRGPWSHGDAGTNNVIYDKHADRARFIDFEIVHDKALNAKSRQADDLLVFMADLIAVAPNPRWLTLVLSFLNSYGNAAVISELEDELAVPGGLAWIWWGVRTSFANPAKVRRRLEKLRDLIANLEFYRAFAAKRARQRRRASIICQQITPGMPSTSSRTRAIKASVMAR